jgi:PhzF family phenazine biosynthesis protein
VVEGGIAGETERVFRNLAAVLEAAGKSFDHVACAGVYLTNMSDFGAMNGTLTLSGKIEAPSGAPSPTDLAAVLSVEPAEVNQVFFAGAGLPFCFAQLSSNEVVDRAAINRSAWAATLARAWSPHVFFFAGNLQDGGKLYARMWAPALGVEEDPATGSACAALAAEDDETDQFRKPI